MLHGFASKGVLLRALLFLYLAIVLCSKHDFLITTFARCCMEFGNAPTAVEALRLELTLKRFDKNSAQHNIKLALADALACDYQLTESRSLISNLLAENPHDASALSLDLQIALLQKDFARAHTDAIKPELKLDTDEVQTAHLMNYVTRDNSDSILSYKWKQWNHPSFVPTYREPSPGHCGRGGCLTHPWTFNRGAQQYLNAQGYYFALNNESAKAKAKFKCSLQLLEHLRFRADYFRFIDSATQYASLISAENPAEARYWAQAAKEAASSKHLPYTEPAEIDAQRRRDIYDRTSTSFYVEGPLLHGKKTDELMHRPYTIYSEQFLDND